MKKQHPRGLKSFILILLLIIIFALAFIVVYEIIKHNKAQNDFQKLAEEISNDSSSGRDLDTLFQKNRECIGWVCIKDTVIDYPVMHTPDDYNKYLYKNFKGEYSSLGVPFLDARCTIDSDNCIIYGHNMRNGQIFASLTKYVNSDYCKKHPEIEFETKRGNRVYKIFAVVSLKENDDWYNFIDTANRKSYKNNVSTIMDKALYTTKVRPKYGQQIVTLSTCYGVDEDGRLIVVAVNTESK